MGKFVKFCLLIATILLFFTTCDTPLKEFIENATGRAVVEDQWEITPNRYTMPNGIIAISPSDEAEYTYLISNIDNPQKGSIKLEMEGHGSEHATAELNDDGQAVITIKNQGRNYEFDLTMNIYVNGRRMGEPKKLPKMQSRYFNTGFHSLEVIDPELENSLLYTSNSNKKNHDVDLPEGVKIIEIHVTLFENVYSTCTIGNGSSNLFDISSGQEKIPIKVTADCGFKKTYYLTASLYGFKDAVVKVIIDGVPIFKNTLKDAFEYISASTIADVHDAYVYVLDDIITDDVFNISYNTGFIQNIYVGCDEDKTISLVKEGSIFSIDSFVVLSMGEYGSGTLTLQGIDNNDSPLVNIHGGTLNLYKGIITGNTNSGNGGGVAVINAGEFNMYGGTIGGNSDVHISPNRAQYGGGVYIEGGTFIFYGGLIGSNVMASSENIDKNGNHAVNGGGVYITLGTFHFNYPSGNGKIAYNYADEGNYGGLYFDPGNDYNYEGPQELDHNKLDYDPYCYGDYYYGNSPLNAPP